MIKKLFIGLIAILVIAAIVGFFLPQDYKVTRSTEVKASKAEVFALVTNLESWPEWTAWTKERYPDIEYKFDSKTKYSWTGEQASFADMFTGEEHAGNGSLEITEADLDKGIVKFKLQFEDYEPTLGTFNITEKDGVTTLEWVAEGDMGTPVIGGYFAMLMDSMMGAEFETGLEKAKKRLEKAE